MLILRRWFIVISLLLNSGCNLLGPTYIKPLTKVPVNWSHQNNIKLDERISLPDLRWWQQFHTAELDDLIQIALHRNNDLNIAMANLDAARAQLLQVKLNWLPGLNFLSGYTQMPYFGNPGRFYIFFPQYVINLFQQYKKQKSAEAMVKASCYAKDAARLTLIAQVASGFFTLIAQQEAMKIYKRLLHRTSHYLLLSQS